MPDDSLPVTQKQFREHNLEDRRHFEDRPTKDEMEQIVEKVVRQVLTEFFITAGKGTKFWLVTTATIIGSVAVIGGGLKWLLAMFGFSIITK